jgi:hypothetical protein
MVPGTIGSLATNEYAWGNNDALGADTLYVRTLEETDPDSEAADYLQVLTALDTNVTKVQVTAQEPLMDFDATSNNPDCPQEWFLALAYNLAVLLSPQYGNPVRSDIKAMADELRNQLYSHDTEPVGLSVGPQYQGLK